tara:strand:- start:155 stop:352 length:198 start_codon:yes stop_codon:yes gene_type:complete
MNYFKGTKKECQDLIDRLNVFFKLPNKHTYTFGYPEQLNNDYVVRIKDKHYSSLSNDEKLKVEEL